MAIPVTTVSRTPQPFSQSAAAISVITHDDIRRSGATSIPEALRLVPGLEVARVDSHQWAISSRGFNDVFANKLLVMIDGRSVYTPLFSGVFWDAQDTLMEDIDRIEVIRGPGASLWGANAVNGVINIITKSAKDTQGFLVSAGGGTEERGFGSFRYGGKINDETFFRIYGKYFDRDSSAMLGGDDAHDAWQMGRGGFRLDWQPGDPNLVTLQGEVYGGELDQLLRRVEPVAPYNFFLDEDTFAISGGNVLGRWTHTISENSNFSLQSYYDRTYRDTAIFREDRDTYDIDFQHRFPIGERQNIIWGAGYRNTGDDVRNSFDISLDPESRRLQLFSAFVQDEIPLVESNLVFTIGSKFEHNDFTGFEVQPSARLLWTPHEKHTLWASVSRAVRTPSRAEADVRLNVQPGPAPGSLVSLIGDDSFDSEELIAYELGYRVQPTKRLSFDLALFYNDYQNIRGLHTGSPFMENSPTPHVVIPMFAANNLKGETYGSELSANWQMLDNWRWTANYTFLQQAIHTKGAPDHTTEREIEGSSPHHQFSLLSRIDLPFHLQFDADVRYVDALPAQGVDSYVTMDARIGWQATTNLEFSIVGQNLLDNRHLEFKPTLIATETTEVERGVYGKVTWRF
jgi:iron complex outermembrane receptor protein